MQYKVSEKTFPVCFPLSSLYKDDEVVFASGIEEEEIDLEAIEAEKIQKLQDLFDYYVVGNPRSATNIINCAINIVRSDPSILPKFMEPENVPLIVSVCENSFARKNAFLFLSILADNEPDSIPFILESGTIKYIRDSLRPHEKLKTRIAALVLIKSLLASPDESVIPLWRAGVFDVFIDDLSDENQFAEDESVLIAMACKCSNVPYQMYDTLVPNLISAAIDIDADELRIIVISSLTDLLLNGAPLDNYIINDGFMEYIACFISSDNVCLSSLSFKLLGVMCPFGNKIYKEMQNYSIFNETRKVLTNNMKKNCIKNYEIIECSALAFLRCWVNNAEEYATSLFSFIAQLNFQKMFEDSKYTTKKELLSFILTIMDQANSDVVRSIINEEFITAIVDSIDSADDEFKEYAKSIMCKSIDAFKETQPEISSAIEDLFSEVEFSD